MKLELFLCIVRKGACVYRVPQNLLGVSIAIHAQEGFGEQESCLTAQKPGENFSLQTKIAGSPYVIEHHLVFWGVMKFVGIFLMLFYGQPVLSSKERTLRTFFILLKKAL